MMSSAAAHQARHITPDQMETATKPGYAPPPPPPPRLRASRVSAPRTASVAAGGAVGVGIFHHGFHRILSTMNGRLLGWREKERGVESAAWGVRARREGRGRAAEGPAKAEGTREACPW
jgi:hypothetical protein